MVAVIVVLAAVCVSCVVSVYLTHRMLAARQAAMAVVVARRAADLTAILSDTEERLQAAMRHRLDTLAENVEGLADATRAVLMHKAVIAAQQDGDQPSVPAR